MIMIPFNLIVILFWMLLLSPTKSFGQSNPPSCPGSYSSYWTDCVGTYVGTNGVKYMGSFKDGKYHGQGTIFLTNGDYIVGQFLFNKLTGQGTFYFLADNEFKGDKYSGSFVDWKFSGQGTYFYANGNKFVGEYKDGKPNGRGAFYLLANVQ